jgi:oligopeptide/dipeptide ABC transporter ATP-binding protein
VNAPLLQLRELSIRFATAGRPIQAVDGVSLDLARGQTVALVGESGCGKSVTALALLGLLPGATVGGSALHGGRDLLRLSQAELRRVRGGSIAIVFQDPMTSLNPVFRIGWQIVESLQLHRGMRGRAARQRAIELLERVGIPAPAQRIDAYAHELSGGMRQRAMLALALAGEPELLIADEPTTALDVTIQAQILDLLADLQREFDMGLLLITHDLGVVAQVADQVHVMYAGRIVESGSALAVFDAPGHGYTHGLMRALPQTAQPGQALNEIPGVVPRLDAPWTACAFAPRCAFAQDECHRAVPGPVGVGAMDHVASCLQVPAVRAGLPALQALR